MNQMIKRKKKKPLSIQIVCERLRGRGRLLSNLPSSLLDVTHALARGSFSSPHSSKSSSSISILVSSVCSLSSATLFDSTFSSASVTSNISVTFTWNKKNNPLASQKYTQQEIIDRVKISKKFWEWIHAQQIDKDSFSAEKLVTIRGKRI